MSVPTTRKIPESRDQIRTHFHHIAQMFASGDFNAPMLVHGKDVPGTATMSKLREISFIGISKKHLVALDSPLWRKINKHWPPSISSWNFRLKIIKRATVPQCDSCLDFQRLPEVLIA